VSVHQTFDAPWTRKHDDPRKPLFKKVPRTVYPTSLEGLIEVCRTRGPEERLRAAGSHWALSEGAISDHTFIETNDPRDSHKAMSRTLHNVIPACMDQGLLDRMGSNPAPTRTGTMVHVEAGKRIYQLYAELDQVDPLDDPTTLAGYMNAHYGNPGYQGPWAPPTLGSAGGQTIIGALTTGTHGGDFDRPPIADSVVAVHLVADGGKHYWIEAVVEGIAGITDAGKLRAEFGLPIYGGPENFEVIRDNDVLDSVLVSVGRFGAIYSVVLGAVKQHDLYERRRMHLWQDLKHQVPHRDSALYTEAAFPIPDKDETFTPSKEFADPCRSLQIVVCLTSHLNFQRNLAGVTKRWEIDLPQNPLGRAERVGKILAAEDPRTGSPRFEHAGNSYPFGRDPDHPWRGKDPSFLEAACSDSSFMRGVVKQAIKEIEDFVESNGVAVGVGIGAVAAVGGLGLAALIPALFLALVVLREILDALDDDDRFGEHMEQVKNALLDPSETDPAKRAAGLFAWQLIAYLAFSDQQGDSEMEAISYAIMDRHNYTDRSCELNVDSIEVFFDAVDDRLIAFVDSLLAFEIVQEMQGKACVGYAALRFMKASRAKLGMQKHPLTVSVEVSALKDVSGSEEMVEFASRVARNPAIDGVIHWGQRNDCTMAEVERRFGDTVAAPGGDLGVWRAALGRVSDNGRLDGFSSKFTRRTGLEVVAPRLGAMTVTPGNVAVGDTVTVEWDAAENPPGASVTFHVVTAAGWIHNVADLPHVGSQTYRVGSQTPHTFGIEVGYQLNDAWRYATQYSSVTVT
jgi:hypothetical protein